MTDISLPKGFEDLQSWSGWCLPTMVERRDRRANSTMEEIQAFYDALLPRLDDILAHLSATKLDQMDTKSEALMNLSLTLAEMAPAVEQFFEPTISYGYDVKRFTQGLQ
ncbi:MAG: hypothetical protein E2O92_02995 [Alphaproteobacteria bacterium]|nr:MAG: hypothetical protein E2O92_02995 [Alphaproteobacteria bacterium]